MNLCHSLTFILLFVALGSEGQSLDLVKKDRTKSVNLEQIKIETADGKHYEFHHPIIQNQWVISEQDSVHIGSITQITCHTRTVKSEKLLTDATHAVGGATILVCLIGLGLAVSENLTSFNANEPVAPALLAIGAGAALVAFGNQLVTIKRSYTIGGKWKLVSTAGE